MLGLGRVDSKFLGCKQYYFSRIPGKGWHCKEGGIQALSFAGDSFRPSRDKRRSGFAHPTQMLDVIHIMILPKTRPHFVDTALNPLTPNP